MSNLEVRTEAIKGNLIGRRVKVMVPYDGGEYAEVGTVTGLAYPLVEVSTGGVILDTDTLINSKSATNEQDSRTIRIR